ncbi:MAG: phosphomannomutase/phosphoglucomutase [Oscillospiraceae bacterium]|jgi:phosphomannomutase/phosphoglucomutase|nr:phosphomannomutase/phosphoglucomutase [Oscillospiraceae bacterium]
MKNIQKTMFREYDVRGRLSDDELNLESVSAIASAFAVFLNRRGIGKIVVGYDSRACSESFYGAAISSFTESGLNVTGIGLALSPVLYFAQHHLNINGAMMITASHNPDGWSGFKLAYQKSLTLSPEDIQELYAITVSGEKLTAAKPGSVRYQSVRDAYIDYICNHIHLNPDRKLRVVIDAANGGAGVYAYELFQRLGCMTFQLNCDPDTTFPRYFPNPSITEAQTLLKKTVLHPYIRADVGLSFDGDGDRIGVLDENGENIWADRLMMLIAKPLLQRQPGAKIIYDVKSTMALEEYVRANGGEPIMWKTGHSYLKRKLREEGATLAGERSGHLYIGGDLYLGFDDGLFAAALILQALSNSGKSISHLLAEFPSYFVSNEIQAPTTDTEKYNIVEFAKSELLRLFPNNKYSEVHGFKIWFEDGWGVIRASSNTPELSIVLEAKTPENLRKYYDIFRSVLDRNSAVEKVWHNDNFSDYT